MKRLNNILAKLIIMTYLITGVLFQNGTAFAQVKKELKVDKQKIEIIVKYKKTTDTNVLRNDIKSKTKASKISLKKKMKYSRIEVLEIGENDDINKIMEQMAKNPDIEYAQPNYKLTIDSIPNDELFSQQWGLMNSGQLISGIKGQEGIDINISKAWELSSGSPSTVVGVLDTGIDKNHEDLKDNIYTNSNEIAGNSIDDDGNGYVDDINGWDFINNDSTIYDSSELDKHGTHIAGIIAAGANDIGIAGTAPGVKIMPLKFIDGDTGYTSDAISAIEYAKQMGVKIINCSFGSSENNPALKEAMANADMLFVCAVGNDGSNTDSNPVYPSCFGLQNIISVAALDNRGMLAPYSNYGRRIDVAAPGVSIESTTPENNYEKMSGTSMAAPYVTGIAALIKSHIPDITPAEMAGRIKGNAHTMPLLDGKLKSGGIADAFLSLTTTSSSNDQETPDDGNQTDDKGSTGSGKIKTYAVAVAASIVEQIHYGENGVNPATGNYSKQYTDMNITSPGFIVNISRTYNSRDDRTTSLMGKGWTFGFEGSFKVDPSNGNLWPAKLPNGSVQVFVRSGDNFTANDSRSKLVKQSDGNYILTTKDQYTYKFNSYGWLVEMKDKNGNAVIIEVDNTNGRIYSVTDQVGRKFKVSYDGNGYITLIQDVKGQRSISYHYDANKRLDMVTDPMNMNIYYEYDTYGYLSKVMDHDKNVLEQVVYNNTSAPKSTFVTKYTDIYGNAYSYTYDTASRKTTILDSSSRQIIKWYDSSYNIIKSEDPEKRQVIVEYYTDPNGYNIYGEEKAVTDRNGNRTIYDRDDRGNIIKITNPDGSSKKYSYDDKNNLIKEEDEEGKAIFYVYDSYKINLIKKVQPLKDGDVYTNTADKTKFAITEYTYYSDSEALQLGYRAKGLLKAEIDPEGGINKYTYDGDGNIKTITDAMNYVSQNLYNEIGWLIETISPRGFRTTYSYDKNGRLLKKTLNNGETTRIVYDIYGRKVQEIAPNIYTATDDELNLSQSQYSYKNTNAGYRYEYYPTGKLKSQTIPSKLGGASGEDDSNPDAKTVYEYDKYGNLKKETKPDGAIYAYDYDVMNRLIKVSFKKDSASAAQTLEEYKYAILSDGKTQKTYKKYLNGSEFAETIYTYDYAGRLIEQKDPDGGEVSKAYFSNGTILSETDANGGTTYYRYDGLNRLMGQWSPSTYGRYNYIGIAYDKAGRKIREESGKNTVSLDEIPTGDRIAVKSFDYYPNGKVKTAWDSSGAKTVYEYDKDGYVTKELKYTNEKSYNITEYVNNHMGKPVLEKLYVSSSDIYGIDEKNEDSTVLETKYEYDKNGNLKTLTNPDNSSISYKYDYMDRQIEVSRKVENENNQLVSVITKTEYDWRGNKLLEAHPKNNMTRYYYDVRGFLERTVQEPSNPDEVDKYYTTLYKYDLAGRKIVEVSPQNYISGKDISIDKMNRTEFTYDKMDRLKTMMEVFKRFAVDQYTTTYVSKAYKYDFNGNIIKELDGEGYAAGTGASADEKINSGYGTEYRYNLNNQQTIRLDAVGKDKGLQFTVKYDYDGMGRKISETNSLGAVTSYYYDDAGNNTMITSRKGLGETEQTIKTMTYDFAGNLKTSTDGNGNTITYEYNALNKVRKAVFLGDESIPEYTVIYRYDKMGNLAMQQASDGRVDLYTYDRLGRQLSHTQQNIEGKEGITTSARYDIAGNAVYETDAKGTVKHNVYDELNRLIKTSTTVTNTNGKKIVHASSYEYDKNGNITLETDWRGNSITSIYDPINRLVEKRDPDDNTIQKNIYNRSNVQIKSIDAMGGETIFTYDKDNRLLTTQDPEKHTTSQMYDNDGNISLKIDGKGNITKYEYDQFQRLTSVTNPLGEKTTYTYDLNGNILTQRDGNGNVKLFEYNAINKLVRRIDPGGRKGTVGSYEYDEIKIEEYTYYPDGSMKTKRDRNGNTTGYTYDCHGRMLSEAIGKDKILYTYDKNGNQLTMTDATGTTARTYDELNRVLTKSVPKLGTSVYRYDITYDDPDYKGFVGESSKDPKGNETIKIYDRLRRLKLVSGDGQVGRYTSYEYDGNGNRTSIRYPDGSAEVYTYYKNNLLNTLVNKKSDGTVLESYSYKYDAANNQISKTDAKGTTSYTYDSLNRLKTVKEPSGKTTEYVFDKAGNRTREIVTLDGKTTSTLYTYNEQNRLVSTLVEVNGERRITNYTYDNNGNMTSRIGESYKKIDPANPPKPHFGMFIPGQAEGGVTEHAKGLVDSIFYYSYDKFNNLIKASPAGAAAAEYKYNGDGLRVEKNVNGKTTRYLYEYDTIVLELDEKGRQTARNVHGINPISRTVDGSTVYYLYNGHADVTALIDGAGTILGTYYYDAFGNIEETTGTVDNPFTYAGYQYDKETGLYYLNSRMYDPKIARFMQEDSYRGDFNDPLSLNLYSYCHNEPIMYWDPTGHMDQWDADREWGDMNHNGTIDGNEVVWNGNYENYSGSNDYSYEDNSGYVYDADTDGIPNWTDDDSEDYMNPSAPGYGGYFDYNILVPKISNLSSIKKNTNSISPIGSITINNGKGINNTNKTLQNIVDDKNIENAFFNVQGTSIDIGGSFVKGFIGFYKGQWNFIKGEWDDLITDPIGSTIRNTKQNFSDPDTYFSLLGLPPLSVKPMATAKELTSLTFMIVTGDKNGLAEYAGNKFGNLSEQVALSLIAKGISKGVSAIKGRVKLPIQKHDITTYQDFVDRSVVGDNLEGHELWQHSNLKANNLATNRLSTPASKRNPVIALDKDTHKIINSAQKNLDAVNQAPIENVKSNAKILLDSGIPLTKVGKILVMALKHLIKTIK